MSLTRLRRILPTTIAAAAATFACLLLSSGCTSTGFPGTGDGGAPARRAAAEEPARAVQAYNVTHVPAQKDTSFTLAFPTGDRQTSALLIEQLNPAEVRLNRNYTYQIRVTNLTNQTIRGINLRSRPMEGLRLTRVSATTRPVGDGQIVYEVGDLAPRESATIEVTGVPDRLGRVETSYAVAMVPPMLNTALNVVNPTLKVTATGPTDADVCHDIIYRYTVTNTGTGLASDVVLEQALPEGLATTDGRSVVTVDLGDIPEGQSRDATARIRATRTGRFTSQAVVRHLDEVIRTGTLTTTTHAPVLAVAVKGPAQEYVGRPVTYEVTVANTGDAPARQTTLRLATSNIGQVVAIRGASNGGATTNEAQLAPAVADPSSAGLGMLAPGESRRVLVTAEGFEGGTMSVTATATATCAPETRDAVRTQLLTVPALLLQAVDQADPVRVGDDVVYTVSVTNQGTGPDTNVRVTATVPENVEFVAARGTTDARAEGRTVTFAPVPRLGPKESATWQVTLRAARAGDVQFKVNATSDSLKVPAEKAEPTKLY